MESTSIDFFGNLYWKTENGSFHREDGPAVIQVSGYRCWYVNQNEHRLNGPALISDRGMLEWIQNGDLHRINGPAVIHPDMVLLSIGFGENKWNPLRASILVRSEYSKYFLYSLRTVKSLSCPLRVEILTYSLLSCIVANNLITLQRNPFQSWLFYTMTSIKGTP